MDSGIEQIHLAAQYLAAAGISFLSKKEDDSHTNLGYSPESAQMTSRKLNKSGDYLALDLKHFSLNYISPSSVSELELDGWSHHHVLNWIKQITTEKGFSKEYEYQFHYTLPYQIEDNFVFNRKPKVLAREVSLRNLAMDTIRTVLEKNSMKSEIRIWPHHLDTGAFALLPDSEEISIGLGLAIPDQHVEEHYFYVSGYRGRESIETSSFEPLSLGNWCQNGFKGAIFKASEADERSLVRFFTEAIMIYRK